MFNKLLALRSAHRLIEEQLYEQVVVELADGVKRQGLWAKAIADSEGHEDKAKSLYIKYRVQSMKDELALLKETESNIGLESSNTKQKEAYVQSAGGPKIETESAKVVRTFISILGVGVLTFWLFSVIDDMPVASLLSCLIGLPLYLFLRFSFTGSVVEDNSKESNKAVMLNCTQK